MDSLKGCLLISNGNLFDPNFRQTVLLVVDHTEEGALGVVLNRESEVTVAEAAPPVAVLVGSDASLFVGGPVQPNAAVVLGEFEDPDDASHLIFDSVGLLTGEISTPGSMKQARVYAGYAGWGPGQLEREMEENSWIVDPATAEDVFTPEPQNLWADVLRRKGGEFKMLARMPFDPSTN
jgi:putative transcriptional regulator